MYISGLLVYLYHRLLVMINGQGMGVLEFLVVVNGLNSVFYFSYGIYMRNRTAKPSFSQYENERWQSSKSKTLSQSNTMFKSSLIFLSITIVFIYGYFHIGGDVPLDTFLKIHTS